MADDVWTRRVTTGPIVDLADVAEAASGRAVVWCDVRWYLDGRDARAAYDAGHLPGAVFIDMDTDLASPPSPAAGRHPLPTPEHFAAALGAHGIADDDFVVAYDDNGGLQAARLVWMLRAIGHAAAVLDGGIDAWIGDLETDASNHAPTTRSVRPWPRELMADIDEVATVCGTEGHLVIDSRAGARYRGETEPVDPVAGHVPGAVNRPVTDNVDDTGRFLTPAELAEGFKSLGVGEGVDTIVYCGSGVTACHNILAMEHAGLGAARLFAGSWSQWSNDPERPVATGG